MKLAKNENYNVSRYELWNGFDLEVVEIEKGKGILREAWLCSETVKKFFLGEHDHQTIYGKATVISLEEFIDHAMTQVESEMYIFGEEESVLFEYWNR